MKTSGKIGWSIPRILPPAKISNTPHFKMFLILPPEGKYRHEEVQTDARTGYCRVSRVYGTIIVVCTTVFSVQSSR